MLLNGFKIELGKIAVKPEMANETVRFLLSILFTEDELRANNHQGLKKLPLGDKKIEFLYSNFENILFLYFFKSMFKDVAVSKKPT